MNAAASASQPLLASQYAPSGDSAGGGGPPNDTPSSLPPVFGGDSAGSGGDPGDPPSAFSPVLDGGAAGSGGAAASAAMHLPSLQLEPASSPSAPSAGPTSADPTSDSPEIISGVLTPRSVLPSSVKQSGTWVAEVDATPFQRAVAKVMAQQHIVDRFKLRSPERRASAAASAVPGADQERPSVPLGEEGDEGAAPFSRPRPARSTRSMRSVKLAQSTRFALVDTDAESSRYSAELDSRDSARFVDGFSAAPRFGGGRADRCRSSVVPALIKELLRRPPEEVASWLLDEIARLPASVGDTPLLRLAEAARVAPCEALKQLFVSVLVGVQDLPRAQRNDALRLVAVTAAAATWWHGDSYAALERFRLPEVVQAEGLLRLASVAGLSELMPEEHEDIAATVREEVARLAEPCWLLQVVFDMDVAGRQELLQLLVHARLLPEGLQTSATKALLPGATVDQLALAIGWISTAKEHTGAVALLSIIEALLAESFYGLNCGAPLIAWLRYDAWLAMFTIIVVWMSAVQLLPVYEELCADPGGASKRWHQAADDGLGMLARAGAALPGLHEVSLVTGACTGVVAGTLLVCGACWALLGLGAVLMTSVAGCGLLVMACCVPFVCLRVGIVVGPFIFVYYWGLVGRRIAG